LPSFPLLEFHLSEDANHTTIGPKLSFGMTLLFQQVGDTCTFFSLYTPYFPPPSFFSPCHPPARAMHPPPRYCFGQFSRRNFPRPFSFSSRTFPSWGTTAELFLQILQKGGIPNAWLSMGRSFFPQPCPARPLFPTLFTFFFFFRQNRPRHDPLRPPVRDDSWTLPTLFPAETVKSLDPVEKLRPRYEFSHRLFPPPFLLPTAIGSRTWKYVRGFLLLPRIQGGN